MRNRELTPVFTEYIAAQLDEGILYVSPEYSTASHLCACGCGTRVVTPLGPADWTLIFDGTVTLEPSIGNGQMPCRSHYLIRHNCVIWARRMSPTQTKTSTARDAAIREAHYDRIAATAGRWSRIRRRFRPRH
jgi:uncharacterized protein DUF6527